MRKFKIFAGLLVLTTVVSCSDFLSEVPDNRTEIDTPEKIAELLVYAYPENNYMYFTEVMSDNAGDSKRVENTLMDNDVYYEFKDDLQESWDSPSWFWTGSYKAIAQANQALYSIDKLGGGTELNALKGEALLARAYSHFMLVNVFAQAFDPSTASTELGVPYMTDVETKLLVNYKRSTVQEVYDLIEKDILEGLPLVASGYKKPRFHFTPAAAKAFAARFYLYKGDFDKVLEYSNDLGDTPVKKLRNIPSYVTSSVQDQQKKFGSQEDAANLLISAGPGTLVENFGFARFGATRDLVNGTLRSNNPFGKSWAYVYQAYNSTDVFWQPKYFYYFKYSNASAGIGQPFVNLVLFHNDELYLNRIEAVVMKGDLERAAKMIAYFAQFKTSGYVESDAAKVTVASIKQRFASASEYEPFYSLSADQQSFIKCVADLRRRDMLNEGIRWFDIKRFNLSVEHKYLVENKTVTLEKKDLRKAIQLPYSVFQYGILPNPRN